MKKTIFEEIGGIYIRHGEYLIPCLTLQEEEQRFVGVWGQRHLRYLKEHKRTVYITLLTSGKLNSYLADIEEQVENMYWWLVKKYVDRQGVTEQMKAEKPCEWISRMSNIQACVREVVNTELIYA